jgi:hypothetical protein
VRCDARRRLAGLGLERAMEALVRTVLPGLAGSVRIGWTPSRRLSATKPSRRSRSPTLLAAGQVVRG